MDAKVQTRKLFIKIARKHQKPGSGSAADFLRGRTAMMQFPDLSSVLEDRLWAVIGAAATRLYMPERATRDLDILVRFQNAAEVRAKLAQAGFTYDGEWSIGGSSWSSPEGFPLDVVECSQGWCEQAIAQAQSNRDAQGAPVLPLPFLVLMKFQAGRAQDLADVTRMLGQAPPEQLAAVRAVFERWLPDEKEDLESFIALGQLEMQPPLGNADR